MAEGAAPSLERRVLTEVSQMLPGRHAKWHSQFYVSFDVVLHG
jgi:hypothetical protein